MSKIFDALRKAERDRMRPARQRKRAAPPRRPANPDAAEQVFMLGLDEHFRRSLQNLRNAIDSEMKNRDSRVILFTSSLPGEGKTTIASFLARLLALGETERVLLVDCSVKRPALHDLFGLERERGIVDYLSGVATLQDVTRSVDEGSLDIVTAGTGMPEEMTQPLFNSEMMQRFVRETGEAYDYVLVDSSAILEAPETPIIASAVDATVLVVQAGKTKREVIKRATMMVEKLGGSFIGTVLNRKRYHIPEFIYRRV